MRSKAGLWLSLLSLAAIVAGGILAAERRQETPRKTPPGSAAASPVFTTAHSSFADAVRDFFSIRRAPLQPIAFTHKVHIARQIDCAVCHPGVKVGPVAGIPGANACMKCHWMVASTNPEVLKVAAYRERGEDIPWQRVYGFSRSAHVRFNHAPHIRAGVDCSVCHGNLAEQTVAVQSVDLTMGFCVRCHREKKAPTECITCHY